MGGSPVTAGDKFKTRNLLKISLKEYERQTSALEDITGPNKEGLRNVDQDQV